jgi:hypothetical protein
MTIGALRVVGRWTRSGGWRTLADDVALAPAVTVDEGAAVKQSM